jgi:filamentous hemagglutinin family protein
MWAGTAYFQFWCIPELPLEALAVTKLSWLSRDWQLKLVGSVAIVGTLLTAVGESVLAQIVPDNTLGAEGSVVTPDVINGIQGDRIYGGAPRGANLFHSFQEFNVGEGRRAYFDNPTGIENILTRVTGGNASNILGRLGVLGEANLFLLNPNGILFGPNASLDVQGSFLATTANAIQFDNGEVFSASTPSAAPILAINPSAFLFNQVPARAITNRSTAGLRVPAGQTLGLIGGDVRLEGGRLTAAGGRIELGSVAGVGQVSLTQTGNRFVLGYDSVSGFGNISLLNRAFVDASGEGGGDVQIRGARLEMREGSNISANTLGAENGGQLTITATERIEVSNSDITALVYFDAAGDGGNVTLETAQLSVNQGGQISVSTFGAGNAGELNLNASEIELIGGNPIKGNPSSLFAFVRLGAIGNGGNINITAGSVSVTGGALILARNAGGQGNAGSVTINATDTVTIAGFEGYGDATVGSDVTGRGTGNGNDVNITARSVFIKDEAIVTASIISGTGGNGNPAQAGDVNITASDTVSVSNSAVLSEIGSSSVGKGGIIKIDAPNVVLENGASLNTIIRPGGKGSGGDIDITTGSLSVTGGSQLFTGTNGTGDAGNITIKASDSVSFDGVGSNRFGRNVFTRIPVIDSSGAYSTVEEKAVGNGGDINITAPSVTLSSNAQLSVETKGDGVAGNLTIDTGRLTVRDGATISASTSSPNPSGIGGNLTVTTTQSLDLNQASLLAQSTGAAPAGNLEINTGNLTARDGTIATSSELSSGGDITITADKIRLYGDSDITTFVAQGAGGGGDIKLTADSILAFDDSDILAFAPGGTGGSINLKTPAFFGENYRPAPRNTDPRTLNGNNRVDVNATGAVEGVITIPDTTFIQNSLTELPDNQINTDSLLANSCIVRRNQPTQGSFTITGSGGLPQRPGDAQMSTFPTVDIETLPSDGTPSNTNLNRPWQKGDPIVEPQGVYRLPNGNLVMSRECS